MKQHHDALARFSEPGAVVAFLTGTRTELDEKDRLLAVLVLLVQGREHTALASALLWLGLWPGLDAVYRRRLWHFEQHPEELVSALGAAFSGLVERLDLRSVRRIAATLVRSTERDVMDGQRRIWTEAERVRIERALRRVPEDVCSMNHRAARSVLPLAPDRSADDEVAALRDWMLPIVGEDSDLVIAVLVLEETQHAAGERLGLSHAASRKRFQRALRRIRTHLAISMSRSDEPERV